MPDEPQPSDFVPLEEILQTHSGIRFGPHKRAMLTARLARRMRMLGIASVGEYCRRVKGDASGAELEALIHAATTHVTHFFREPDHFRRIEGWLRQWERDSSKPIRIWSAACATGEEPYSIAITARNTLIDPARVRILATDLSHHVLDEARKGVFPEASLRETPIDIKRRFFRPVSAVDGSHFQLDPAVVGMVRFAPLNLVTPPYPFRSPIDLILCRNVMIYFDNDLRKRILAEMQRVLKPGGFLLVGHAESLSGMLSDFTCLAPSIYTTKGAHVSAI